MGLRRRPEEEKGWSTKKKIGIGVLVFFVIIIVAGALLPSGEKEEVTEPGEFVVSNLAISPSEVDPGQTVSVSVDVKNTGGEEGTKSLKLSVDGETKTESVILESNQSKTVFFKLSESKEGTYDVSISGMYGNFEVKVPAPAEFEVSNLTVSPSQVKVGERVTVSADVKNVGGEGGSYIAELRFAWGVDDTYEVILNPGESTKVTFSFTVEEPGTYHPRIGNLSGSFEVKPIFEIVDYLRYLEMPNGLDYVWISGTIKNNSSKPITPQVQVKYYDQEGFVIDTDRLSYPLTIAPNRKFPFRTRRIRAEVNEIADYGLNSSFFASQGNYLEEFVVIGQSVEQNGLYDKYTVTVEFQNKTDEMADSVYVQVAFYDEKGEMIGVGLSEGSAIGVFPIHDVSPREKRRVKILCGSEDSVTKPSDYEIFISGWT